MNRRNIVFILVLTLLILRIIDHYFFSVAA